MPAGTGAKCNDGTGRTTGYSARFNLEYFDSSSTLAFHFLFYMLVAGCQLIAALQKGLGSCSYLDLFSGTHHEVDMNVDN